MPEIDDTDEITPEAKIRMSEAADEIVDICQEICEHPSESLNAMSGALAYLLCESVVSKEAAVQAIQLFANSTLASIEAAEEDNNVAWRQQRH